MAKAKKTKSKSQYGNKLKALKKIGVYNPTSDKLTEWRKRQINSKYREYEYLLTDKETKFVPIPKGLKAFSKKITRLAKSLDMEVTPKGIFISKRGYKNARLDFNPKTKEFEIIQTHKRKKGKTGSSRHRAALPLTSVDALTREKEKLRAAAESFGKLKKNERLYFKVHNPEGAGGMSHSTFADPDLLMNYLETHYVKHLPDKVRFLRMISIEKTTYENFKSTLQAHKGNSHSAQRRKYDRLQKERGK